MDKIVEIKNLSKIYTTGEKEFKALDNIDLDIKKGEFVVALGPSGAGKSTLLNLIGGMDSPTSGTIKIDGEDISKYNEIKLSEYRAENIGFIFQFYNILPTLTVLENVELIKDVVKNGIDSKEAIKSVGLEAHMNKFPNQLSGGEQQRVSIARAIAKDPKLLLCDEPTGALDSKTGVEVLKLLKKQCDGNNGANTVIIVTHNSLLADIADTVITVKNGKIESVISNQNPKKIDKRLLACYGNIDVQQKALAAGQIGKARKCQKMLEEYLNELDNESYREMAVKYKREKFAELVMERVAVEKKNEEYMNYMKEFFNIGTASNREQAYDNVDKIIKKLQVNLVEEKANEKTTELELQIG